jgi:hypothetical protein
MASRRIRIFLIVVGLLACAAVAIPVALINLRAGYRFGSDAEAVAYNYILAVERGNYARAYGYLSPNLPGYPSDVDVFRVDVRRLADADLDMCYYVESSSVSGRTARVSLREQLYDPCLLIGRVVENLTFSFVSVTLEDHEGDWKVANAQRNFAPCWMQERGCP